jgi:hypothetical protein
MLAEVAPSGTTTVNTGMDILFTASNTGGTPPYSYQWTENSSNISGATGPSYAANKGSAGSFTYNCKVTDSSGRCANIVDSQNATGTWLGAAPKRVAYSVTPTNMTTTDHGNTGTVTWDVASCPSTNYHIIWGLGDNVATLDTASPNVSGAKCAIGATGSTLWNPTPTISGTKPFIWFLVVGDNGATTEGSWGQSATGEEGRTMVCGYCSMATHDNSGSCGTP